MLEGASLYPEFTPGMTTAPCVFLLCRASRRSASPIDRLHEAIDFLLQVANQWIQQYSVFHEFHHNGLCCALVDGGTHADRRCFQLRDLVCSWTLIFAEALSAERVN